MYPHRKAGTEVTGKQIMASSHYRTGLGGITIDASEFTLLGNLDADYIIDLGVLWGKLDNGLYCLWARQALASDATGGTTDPDVEVKNAAPFKVGDAVTLANSDPITETAVILSIDYVTNIITMTANVTSAEFTTAKKAELYITDGGEISEAVLGFSDVDMELHLRATTSEIADQATSVLKHGAVLKARLPQWVQDALDYVTGCSLTGGTDTGVKGHLEGRGGNQIEFVE